jgi:leader peptidase (prepilin peptidase) / N-methyltransferase
MLTAGCAVAVTLRRAASTVPHGPSMCLAAAGSCALAVL